jgi:hypothetical protein
VPTISRFFGITIRMYFDDHDPAHFHVYYGSSSGKIAIDTLDVMESDLPRRAVALVLEWANAHRDELRENWRRARDHEPLERVDPLE